MTGYIEHLADFLVRNIHRSRDFFLGWLPLQNLLETMPSLLHPVDRFPDVNRQPDGAALIGDRPGDSLANPPSCIGAELESTGVIELVGRLHQADIPFLNQIKEGKTTSDVFLRDRDDEPEIRLDEMSASGIAVDLVIDQRSPYILGDRYGLKTFFGKLATLHPFGEPDLF